jgi:hypothetical protein
VEEQPTMTIFLLGLPGNVSKMDKWAPIVRYGDQIEGMTSTWATGDSNRCRSSFRLLIYCTVS